MASRPEVGRPLPDISDHVVDSIAVWRKRSDRRCVLKAVLLQVLLWKRALPGVGHLLAARRELVTPSVFRAIKPAARGKLPLSLSRQFLARPARVSLGVAIGDMHDGVVVHSADRAARPIGPSPIGAKFEPPPLRPVLEIDRPLRRRKDERSRFEHVRQRARVILRPWRDLGEGDMLRCVDELAEMAVRHRRAVDPERVDVDPVDWRLLGIVLVRSHVELAPRHEDHVGTRIRLRRFDAVGNLAQ